MALRIGDYKMSSNRSPHTARLAPGKQYAWEVSWLPGRHLNRNEAITAMVLADTTADGDVRPGHRAWPHVQGWADELGLTGPQALDRVADPPRWATHQEKTADSPGPEPPVTRPPRWAGIACIEDPDPIDLGWVDDYDWPAPEYPDPSWPGFAASRRRHPTHLSDRDVSDWHMERHPGKSEHPGNVPHAGRDPHPTPEPDSPPDWEAGQ